MYFRIEFQRRVALNGEIVVRLPMLSLNENTSGYETLISLPLEYRRKVLSALATDLFDITGKIEPGEHWITVELAGIPEVASTRGIVGFDVYEGRSW